MAYSVFSCLLTIQAVTVCEERSSVSEYLQKKIDDLTLTDIDILLMYVKLKHASSMHENLNNGITDILVYFITLPSVPGALL